VAHPRGQETGAATRGPAASGYRRAKKVDFEWGAWVQGRMVEILPRDFRESLIFHFLKYFTNLWNTESSIQQKDMRKSRS
jgi:hypothetical protein